MKRVFRNHDEVCHVWAQQTQSEGKAGNIFFEGKSIYSYGRHFEAARFVDAGTVFITTRRYSVSTAKHLTLVCRAVSHKQVFEVPSFTNHAENVQYYIDRARESFDKAKRARTSTTYLLGVAKHTVTILREYLEQFPTPIPESHAELWIALDHGTYLDGAVQATLLKKEREARKAELESQRLAREAREREEQERLEKWIAGEMGYGYFSAMRLRVRENEVETTHGARVPVIEARKLYRALKAGVNIEGQQVGYYRVTRVTDSELVIGCHNIPLSEVERIAPEVMSKPLVEV
jgi:hypothetical protein